MPLPEINFVHPREVEPRDTKAPKTVRYIFFSLGAILIAAVLYILFGIFMYGASETSAPFLNTRFLAAIPRFLFGGFPESGDKKLSGEERGRVNILFLGIGGKGHDGGMLSDTTMLASLDPQNKKVALLSIPRDLVLPVPEYGWRKVNALNAFGEVKSLGSGASYAREILEVFFGEPIDYYVRVDFAGFEKFIDLLGGVDIIVENDLVDNHYPILGKEDSEPISSRYETLYIQKGPQHFNGVQALRYVRSRYALPPENSDFSRMRRQQKLLEAVYQKIADGSMFKISRLAKLMNLFAVHVSTNFSVQELASLFSIARDIKKDQIASFVLKPGPGGLLQEDVGIDGAYILKPPGGDFSEIRRLVKNLLFIKPTLAEVPKKKGEGARLIIRNGTAVNGMAMKTAASLEQDGFQIIEVGNAAAQDYEKTVIYVLRNGYPGALEYLRNRLSASVALLVPDHLKNQSEGKTDFLIILGKGKSG
jgi:LCP family protein required for cell wall assembly